MKREQSFLNVVARILQEEATTPLAPPPPMTPDEQSGWNRGFAVGTLFTGAVFIAACAAVIAGAIIGSRQSKIDPPADWWDFG